MKKIENNDCATCYKIICKQCKWEADDAEVAKIQCGELIACPRCGWQPGQRVL